jgi:hypothetical protein
MSSFFFFFFAAMQSFNAMVSVMERGGERKKKDIFGNGRRRTEVDDSLDRNVSTRL